MNVVVAAAKKFGIEPHRPLLTRYV
jgi:hypothetical protein